MTGDARRERILELLDGTAPPVSAARLAEELGVSEQMIAQDISLLRRSGNEIAVSSSGYALERPYGRCVRLFKVRHSEDQLAEELEAIIALGAAIDDVIVHSPEFGVLSATLNLSTYEQLQSYLADVAENRTAPLSRATRGYHRHHISAESEEILDRVGAMLVEKGFLTQLDAPKDGAA